jgi:arylsulfatase A-like enzyme
MALAEPDFSGRIGRIVADSVPAWPPLPTGLGGPNIVMIVLDDTGFAHFGCYGSDLRTPNIDALAAGGLRYTGFHTTALCSPTRACLLTGRNHHSVGMRGVSNWNTGFPHMRGGITPRAATIAELLRDHGYATYAAGKWHLAPMEETSAAGPHRHWPLQKGFDRYYGFLQGEADQFAPELTRDNHHCDPPSRGAEGYHLSEDLVDESTGWIRDLISVRPDRPFFLYLAFGAMHAPHHSPQEFRDRWRGAFDEGYETVRQRWFERQLELGIIPPGTVLSDLNPGVPAWSDLTDNQQRFSARLQEAFAAMLEHTDAQIGRLVAFLDHHSLLDNTLLMVLSDNGASREGGPFGTLDEFSMFNGRSEDIDAIVRDRLDDIGGPASHSNYPWGWAQAGNSPMRWYKQHTYGGGVRDPLVVHWPTAITQPGAIRPQFCHAIDIAATVLGVAGVELPSQFGGHPQIPLHGRSIAATFADADAAVTRSVQYFEQVGHRAIWADGWKATSLHIPGTPFDDDEWELFHLDQDFSECTNLADSEPARLRHLIDRWWAEAGAMDVLPLDDRNIELFAAAPRPGSPHARAVYRYFPPISHIPSDAAPALGSRPWNLDIDIVVAADQTVSGVLYARGSHNVGHSFFVSEGCLHFDYNALGSHSRASADLVLAPGSHTLSARFERIERSGRIIIGVDGRDLAEVDVHRPIRILGSTGMDIGRDALSTVVSDYSDDFPFSAHIESVTFTVTSRRSANDVFATAVAEMARE